MARRRRVRPDIKNPWVAWAWDTGERVVRNYAGAWTAIYLAGDKILGFWSASFTESLIAAAFASFVSAMFSLAGKTRGATDSASVLNREQDPPVKP